MAKVSGETRKRYSHNGCKECKRRKIKCNEGKPACWHCDRLDKECKYEGKKRTSKNVETETNNPHQIAPERGNNVCAEKYKPAKALACEQNNLYLLNHSSVEEVQDWFTLSGASLLTHDLSGLVCSKLNELTSIEEPLPHYYSVPDGITLDNQPSISSQVFQKDVPLSYITLTGQNKFYLKDFYYGFSNIILPFHAIVDGIQINPVRDILMIYAREYYHLLYALLACGARTSYKKTMLPEDQSNYKFYLRSCLQSLTTVMDQDLVAKLDSILLTILVLVCDNASSESQAWRTHLRGARGLLLKNCSQSERQPSLTLLLCRSWYSSIEILAGLVSPSGGTLKSCEELDLLILPEDMNEQSALRKLNLVRSDGYSLFHGYSTDLVSIFKDLIKLLRAESEFRHDYWTISNLISRVKDQLEFSVVDKSGVIPETHPCHPRNSCFVSSVPSDTIGEVEINGDLIAFSWLDISHRSYTLAALVTIFTKILHINKNSKIVQGLIRDLLDTAVFLDDPKIPSKSFCSFLLQWPMLVAGSNSVQDDDKMKVETFFRLLAQLGSGSAGFVLIRMKKIWSQELVSEDENVDGVDIVTY